MKPRVLVLHGPNLNMLGHRKKEHYGSISYDSLIQTIKNRYSSKFELIFFQSNYEGDIIKQIHNFVKHNDAVDIVVTNLGAFTHYSYAIADALEMLNAKVIEVHLSDVTKREEFRKISVLEHMRTNKFYGKQEQSYFEAFEYLINDK